VGETCVRARVDDRTVHAWFHNSYRTCLLLSRCRIERALRAIEFALLARFWAKSLYSSQKFMLIVAQISLISFVSPLTSRGTRLVQARWIFGRTDAFSDPMTARSSINPQKRVMKFLSSRNGDEMKSDLCSNDILGMCVWSRVSSSAAKAK